MDNQVVQPIDDGTGGKTTGTCYFTTRSYQGLVLVHFGVNDNEDREKGLTSKLAVIKLS
ncbi:hypothetical protein GW781_01905 [bacterium]|nr:hypothetical protein [bacterium]